MCGSDVLNRPEFLHFNALLKQCLDSFMEHETGDLELPKIQISASLKIQQVHYKALNAVLNIYLKRLARNPGVSSPVNSR